jgi:hypothetical protein
MERQSASRIVLVVFIAAAVGVGFWPASKALADRGACADDVLKFCKDVQPGEGRIIKCMKEHENELSPGCKAQLAHVKEKVREAREACEDDILRFCGNVKPGGGRIVHCLKEHEIELSPQCKAKMEEHQQKKAQ